MKEKPFKIILPKDPYQIGQTKDGQPIWVDPKDFIQTPDEKVEQKDNMASARVQQQILQIARQVLDTAQLFIKTTLDQIIPESIDNAVAFSEWEKVNGLQIIQDGLTTIIKVKGKVVRTMHANVEKRFAIQVAKKVMELCHISPI